MAALIPNSDNIYHDFKSITANKCYSAVFKEATFEKPRTYVSKANRGYSDTERCGESDDQVFDLRGPEGFVIQKISHDTTYENLIEMENANGFRMRGGTIFYKLSGKNILPDVDGSRATISWWAARPNDEDISALRMQRGEPTLYTSRIFNRKIPCVDGATRRISCSVQDALTAYGRNWRNGIEMRVLGTFRYIAEIMYAILVCPKGVPEFDRFPKLENINPENVIPEPPNVRWLPYCTVHDARRMWDHLSYAFYLPENEYLEIPRENVEVCDITEIETSR